MDRLYCTLGSTKPLIVIPDVSVQTDGSQSVCPTYHIFLNRGEQSNEHLFRDSNLPEDYSHPHYYGKILFERPGQLFTYLEGDQRLTRAEVEEVIDCITNLRDNPHLWRSGGL